MSKTSDLVQLAKHLSFHRVLNITKLYSSFLISRIIKKPIVWGMPFTVSIEPTTACNLSCPECPSGKKEFTRDTGKISVNDNEFLLASLGKQVMYINYYFQSFFSRPHCSSEKKRYLYRYFYKCSFYIGR